MYLTFSILQDNPLWLPTSQWKQPVLAYPWYSTYLGHWSTLQMVATYAGLVTMQYSYDILKHMLLVIIEMHVHYISKVKVQY